MPDERKNHLTPPPQKRIKSADLYRAQHGLSPERDMVPKDVQPLLAAVVSHRRSNERNRDRERNRASSCDQIRSRDSSATHDRDRSAELRDSLLGQALEGGPTLTVAVLFHSNVLFLFLNTKFFPISKKYKKKKRKNNVHGVRFSL